MEVIAKDKKGRPVTDLAGQDFTLKDNGQPQKLTLFSISQAPAAPQIALAESAPPPSAPNVFSNIHAAEAAPVIILMDQLNTPWDNQTAMKTSLIASLKRTPSHAPTALLTLGDNLTLVSDFTTDPASLATLLDKPSVTRQEGIGPDLSAPKTPNARLNDVILKASLRAFNEESAGRLTRTMTALNLIRNQLSRMPGRKSLIWIGGGLSTSPGDWPAVNEVINKLNDANVAVYTVDARGVLMDFGVGSDTDDTDMLGPWKEEQSATRGDILDVVARNTGGIPYRNTNALDRAITRAVEDNSAVYTLSYYPQRGEWQGKAHKIEIKVARAGVTLRYRSEYSANAPTGPDPTNQQQMLQSSATSPLEFPGIRFSVELKLKPDPEDCRKEDRQKEDRQKKDDEDKEESDQEEKPNRIDLVMHVLVKELQLSLQDGKSTGALQFWLIQRHPSGADVTHKTSAFTFQLAPSELDSAIANGLSFTFPLTLKPSTTKVRVLLRDMISGRIGTVDVPINLSKVQPPEY